jgi:hypothetical protein
MIHRFLLTLAMQKVEGSRPFSSFQESPPDFRGCLWRLGPEEGESPSLSPDAPSAPGRMAQDVLHLLQDALVELALLGA